jgi:hypothetical protein
MLDLGIGHERLRTGQSLNHYSKGEGRGLSALAAFFSALPAASAGVEEPNQTKRQFVRTGIAVATLERSGQRSKLRCCQVGRAKVDCLGSDVDAPE